MKKGTQLKQAHVRKANALKKASQIKKNAQFIAALALSPGESMNVGMARMALTVTLNFVNEAEFEVNGKMTEGAGPP